MPVHSLAAIPRRVVAIRRNKWSQSIGTGGRNQSVRAVAINRNGWSRSVGARTPPEPNRKLLSLHVVGVLVCDFNVCFMLPLGSVSLHRVDVSDCVDQLFQIVVRFRDSDGGGHDLIERKCSRDDRP